ncbi:hypothetical protein [Providencia sp. PROV236]|uniref:hypothetical protein n=1 Tax=Providencia sp. PROV236 TaxID=2936798 RepID=UPI0034E1A4DC
MGCNLTGYAVFGGALITEPVDRILKEKLDYELGGTLTAILVPALFIDLVHESMQGVTSEEALMIHNEAMRRIMDAQMWAVKAITWKD